MEGPVRYTLVVESRNSKLDIETITLVDLNGTNLG